MSIKFGPSGNSESFYEEGYKSSIDMPQWLSKKGLTAYEYSCTKGVRLKQGTAKKIGQKAKEYGIFLSIHAPYYINLCNQDPEKREKSKGYIFDTLRAAKWMGAKRIVFHPGSYSKINRELAFNTAINTLKEVLDKSSEYEDILLCPETMGKRGQLGTLEEIINICKLSDRLLPTIDFGHIHARDLGILNVKEDYYKIINIIEFSLGFEKLKNIHIHFSRIEFTQAGEKKHWSYKDIQHGPDFDPLAEILIEKQMEPVIICESRGTMAEDALILKEIYEKELD